MELLIQTPLYHENKYLPHLLEHCVLYSQNDEELLFLSDIFASTRTGYTSFDWKNMSLEEILFFLERPVDENIFFLQQKVVKNELNNSSFWQKLYEKILQKINKNFRTNSLDSISLEELLNYQKQRYQKKHMLLLDEEWKIIFDRGKGKTLKKGKLSLDSFQFPETLDLSYQKEHYHLLLTKNIQASTTLVVDFFGAYLEDMLYLHDSKAWKYYYERLDYSLADSFFLISREKKFPKISRQRRKQFFDLFQPYYCEKIRQGEKRAYIPQIALFTQEYFSREEHIRLISHLDFSLILELLKRFRIIM